MLLGMRWHERLNAELRRKNWGVADLVREMGAADDKATLDRLYKYTSGNVENPRGDWMERIAKAIGLSEDQLRYGANSSRLIRPSGPERSEVEKVGDGLPDLGNEWMDLLGVAEGGPDGSFSLGEVIDHVRRPPGLRKAKDAAALNVVGDSMVPRFKPGELIYVTKRPPAPGDDVVIELYEEIEGTGQKTFLKELVRKTGLRIFCKQHNPETEIEFDAGEVKTLWRVVPLRELLF